jgi:hypothetical protein
MENVGIEKKNAGKGCECRGKTEEWKIKGT